MQSTRSDYYSYLLRLWQVKGNGVQWRASLEDVQTGALHGFTDLTALFSYLAELGYPHPQEDEVILEQQQD